ANLLCAFVSLWFRKTLMRHSRIFSLGLLLVLFGSTHSPGSHRPPLQTLSFEENRGQAPLDARFIAHGRGYNLMLTPEGNRLLLRSGHHAMSIDTTLVSQNEQAAIRAEQKQAGKVHYLRGRTSLTDIPTYARVRYESVYPGIDLVYYGNE